MPNSTVRANAEGLPTDNFDAALDQFNIVNDANLLRHLVDTADSLMLELGSGPGHDQEIERVSALVRIARDLSERLSVDVAAIFQPKEMKPWMR
jgi:hypothetical protein